MYHKSFLAKVLGSDFKELKGYEVIDLIDKELKSRGDELTDNQKSILGQRWAGEYGWLPFEAFGWVKDDERPGKPSPLWRLSAIPLGVWMLLLYLFMPIKWLITGVPYYRSKRNKEGKPTIGSITAEWIDKVKKAK